MAAAVETLLPSACAACGQPLPGSSSGLCPPCWGALRAVDEPRCPRCAGAVDDPTQPCLACVSAPPPQAATVVWGEYAGTLRAALLALKHHGHDELAGPLARRVAERVVAAPWAGELDAVVAVPSHPLHRLRRGFAAADLLGRAVARQLGLPSHVWLRRRGVRRQAVQARAARRRLSRASFAASAAAAGHRVLLVDDVTTTGSTLRRASEALLAAGAPRVYCAALAATPDPRRLP